MQTVPYIIEYQEMHIWNTVWDTIGPHIMQTRLTSGSGKDCSHCEFTITKNNPLAMSDVRTHMILQEIHQRLCVDHSTNGKFAKERCKVPME
jgi:hypothetical protein